MKWFTLLLCVGASAASLSVPDGGLFDAGSAGGGDLVYKYRGRLLTGLPELSPMHWSGLAISCNVHLQPRDDGLRWIMWLSNAKFVTINGKLQAGGKREDDDDDDDRYNWRHLSLPPLSALPAQLASQLELPAVLGRLPSGEIDTLIVDERDVGWSVNFKKALAVLLQTKVGSISGGQGPFGMEQSAEESADPGSFWTVKETSLDGVCDTWYQLNPIPAYEAEKLPAQLVPHPELCAGRDMYELVKTKDVDSCSRRATYTFYKPGSLHCPSGNCAARFGHSSTTRYMVCGRGRDMTVQSVVSEGELQKNLVGLRTEKFLTGTEQRLSLVSRSRRSAEPAPGPRNPRTMSSLMYEFSATDASSSSSEKGGDDAGDDFDPHRITGNIREVLLGREMKSNLNGGKLKANLEKMLRTLVNEDLGGESDLKLERQQIPLKVLNVARALGMMRLPDIRKVYNQLKSEFQGQKREVFMNVFSDGLMMSGSVDSFIFVQELIESREMSRAQISSVLASLPTYILTPTESLLERLFDLSTSERIRACPMLRKQALMAFATLVNRACLSDERDKSYPVDVYGRFCHKNAPVVVRKLVPHLHKILQRSEQEDEVNMAIVALGLVDHEDVVPIILPIIEKTESTTTDLNRFLAIYSLLEPGMRRRELVLPVLVSVFSNRAESTDMRMAAFKAIMALRPHIGVLQKVVMSTWHERDTEILKAVNVAFVTLRRAAMYPEMRKQALMLYPLIKPIEGVVPSSGIWHEGADLEELGVGFRGVLSWLASREDILPKSVYAQAVHIRDSYVTVPFMAGLRLSGMRNIVEALQRVSAGVQSQDELEEKLSQHLGAEWKHVVEQLGIETPRSQEEQGGTSGIVFAKLFQSTPIFSSFKMKSAKEVQQKMESVLRSLGDVRRRLEEAGGASTQINAQRTFDISAADFAVPSDMGFPIVVEMHLPLVLGIRGETGAQMSRHSGRANFSAKVRLFAAWQQLTTVGTLCPFTNEDVLTGVSDHTGINVPAEIELKMDVREQKVSVTLKPLREVVRRQVEMASFHVIPFTVATGSFKLNPVTLESTFRPIESDSDSKSTVWRFGDYLGMSMKANITTESHLDNFRGAWEMFKWYAYNPVNMLRFGSRNSALTKFLTPSVRQHRYAVAVDSEASTTREVKFEVKVGVASKKAGEPIKYHCIEVDKEDAWKSEGGPLAGLLPLKRTTKPISQHEGHELRRQKLQSALTKSEVDEGSAAIAHFSVVLTGKNGGRRSMDYVATVSSGDTLFRSKWRAAFESEHSGGKVCLEGETELPRLPLWKIPDADSEVGRYRYQTMVGFGSSCTQSQIMVQGTALRSPEQARFSRESAEAKMLDRMRREAGGDGIVELSDMAEMVRRQATTLDQLDYTIEYRNVPDRVIKVTDDVFDVIKVISMVSMSSGEIKAVAEEEEDGVGGHSEAMLLRIKFHAGERAADFVFTRHGEKVIVKDVYVAFPLDFLVPPRARHDAGSGPMKDLARALTGRPLYPVCKMENAAVATYDNLTSSARLDDCFHLLTADCSSAKSFGVLVRALGGGKKEMKIYMVKMVIKMKPKDEQSRYSKGVEVIADGETIQTRKGAKVSIKDSEGNTVATVEEFADDSIELKSSRVNVRFDGSKIEVEGPMGLKGQLCGLCGDSNNQKVADQPGPGQCVFSKPEILLASYRVSIPGHACSPLQGSLRKELRQETEQCTKYKEIPTKVTASVEREGGPCTVQTHLMQESAGKTCFSRQPVTSCSAGCRPAGPTTEKTVSMGCLDAGSRLARSYAEKVRAGRVLPELDGLPKAARVTADLPVVCQPADRGL